MILNLHTQIRILRDSYSYLRNDVLVICALKILKTDFVRKIYCSTVISKSQQKISTHFK